MSEREGERESDKRNCVDTRRSMPSTGKKSTNYSNAYDTLLCIILTIVCYLLMGPECVILSRFPSTPCRFQYLYIVCACMHVCMYYICIPIVL